MRIVGILLIVIGVISLALGGISYTKREKGPRPWPDPGDGRAAENHSRCRRSSADWRWPAASSC